MSSESLKPNSLYILLFGRDDPPFKEDYFHWALYIHRDQNHQQGSDSTSTLHHAVCPEETFFTKHEPLPNILNETHLVSALRIADIPTEETEDHVNRILKSYDSRLDEISNISCMAWAFQILKLLQVKGESTPSTIVKCSDLDALQKEMADFGNETVRSSSGDPTPLWPTVRASSLCGL